MEINDPLLEAPPLGSHVALFTACYIAMFVDVFVAPLRHEASRGQGLSVHV